MAHEPHNIGASARCTGSCDNGKHQKYIYGSNKLYYVLCTVIGLKKTFFAISDTSLSIYLYSCWTLNSFISITSWFIQGIINEHDLQWCSEGPASQMGTKDHLSSSKSNVQILFWSFSILSMDGSQIWRWFGYLHLAWCWMHA